MPVTAWIDPVTAEEVPLSEGPALFEEAGILPAESTQMMLDDIQGERSEEDPRYLSPSKLFPGMNCRREIILHRFVDYALDPRALWAACEGTLWHKAFAHATAGAAWMHEVKLPEHLADYAGPRPPEGFVRDLRLMRVCEDDRERLEVYPGVWLKGTVDRLARDYSVLIDHKTTKPPYFPKGGGEPKDYAFDQGDRPGQVTEWSPQILTYAYMVEMLTGVLPSEAWAWRLYRGCGNSRYTFRKLRIPIVAKEQVWAGIKEYCESLLAMLQQAWALKDDKDALLAWMKKSVPMDGHEKGMFNGKKCTEYCALKPVCFGAQGFVDF